MTSKERVMAAFHREQHDRVPIDYDANPGIERRLMAHYGAKDKETLLQALGVDFRALDVAYQGPARFPAREGRRVDPVYGYYTRWVEHSSGGYWDFCDFPLAGAEAEALEGFPVPSPDDFDYTAVADRVRAYGDRAVYIGNPGYADIINSAGRVMGMEDVLVNLQIGDEATLDYIGRVADMQLGVLERMLEAAGGGVDFLMMGEDLGTQHTPLISLELYRKTLRPIHQRYIDLAKSYALPVMVHTCGASSWVYEDFIAMGVDAVDTLQPEATGMDPASLVARFGGRLAFHGCISTAGPLAYGTPEEVRTQVRDTLDIMMPTRAYMCAPTHMIQDNSPTENVVAMYEAAAALGRY